MNILNLQSIPKLNNNNNNMINNIICDNKNIIEHFINDYYENIIEHDIIQNNINNNIQNNNIVNIINNNIQYNILIEQIQNIINNINNKSINIYHNILIDLIELIQKHIINNINNNQYNTSEELDDVSKLVPEVTHYHILDLEDSDEKRNIPKCSICLYNKCTIVLIPCGHVCICRSCSPRIDRCPICRSLFKKRQTLFFV